MRVSIFTVSFPFSGKYNDTWQMFDILCRMYSLPTLSALENLLFHCFFVTFTTHCDCTVYWTETCVISNKTHSNWTVQSIGRKLVISDKTHSNWTVQSIE